MPRRFLRRAPQPGASAARSRRFTALGVALSLVASLMAWSAVGFAPPASAAGEVVSTLPGIYSAPTGIAVDTNGDIYVAEYGANRISRIRNGVSSVFAGSGIAGLVDGAASEARFTNPFGLALIATGTYRGLYVADFNNNAIRLVDLDNGAVSLVAGSSTPGFQNGRARTTARLNGPAGVAADPLGYLYVTDNRNHTIRAIDLEADNVTTLAGTPGSSGFTDRSGSEARFTFPIGITFDSGRLVVGDTYNHAVRSVQISTGSVQTMAQTTFDRPTGVAVDPSGVVYVADQGHNRIQQIATDGTVTTVSGNSADARLVDGDVSTARFSFPNQVVLGPDNALYVADQGNNRARRISPPAVCDVLHSSGTGTWSDSNAWTPARVPLETDRVCIYGGSITLDANAAAFGLDIRTASLSITQGKQLSISDIHSNAVQIEDGRLSFDGAGGSLVVEGEIIVRGVHVDPADQSTIGIGTGTGPGTIDALNINLTSTNDGIDIHMPALFASRPLKIILADVNVEHGRLTINTGGSIAIEGGGSLVQTGTNSLKGIYDLAGDLIVQSNPTIGSIDGSLTLRNNAEILNGTVAAPGISRLNFFSEINGTLTLINTTNRVLDGVLNVDGRFNILNGSDFTSRSTISSNGTPFLETGVFLEDARLGGNVNGGLQLKGSARMDGSFSGGVLDVWTKGATHPFLSGVLNKPTQMAVTYTMPVTGPALDVRFTAATNTVPLFITFDPAGAGWVDGTPSELPIISASSVNGPFTIGSVQKGPNFDSIVSPYIQRADPTRVVLSFSAPTLAFTAASPPAGEQSATYPAYQFTVTPQSPASTFTVTAGRLPQGMSLDSDGLLSGTPTSVGTHTFAVQATNGTATATAEVTLTIRQNPADHTSYFDSDDTWASHPTNPFSPTNGAAVGVAQELCLASPCLSGTVDLSTLYGGFPVDLSAVPAARWIWLAGTTGTTTGANNADAWFRKTINVPGTPTGGTVRVAVDNGAEVFVNGTSIGSIGILGALSDGTSSLRTLTISATLLVSGDNIITVRAKNDVQPQDNYQTNPASLLFHGEIHYSTETTTTTTESTTTTTTTTTTPASTTTTTSPPTTTTTAATLPPPVVLPSGPANKLPVGSMVAVNPPCGVGQPPTTDGVEVEFDLSRSRDPDGTIQAWTIRWDDGTDDLQGTGRPGRVRHTFTNLSGKSFQYIVELRLKDDRDAWSNPFNVEVLVAADGHLVRADDSADSPKRPVIRIDAQPTNDPFVWTLDLSKSSDPDGSIKNWRVIWDDDSTDASGVGPLTVLTHRFTMPSFAGPALFAVKVQATDQACRNSLPNFAPVIIRPSSPPTSTPTTTTAQPPVAAPSAASPVPSLTRCASRTRSSK